MITYTLLKNFSTDAVDIDSEDFCFEYSGAAGAGDGSEPIISYPPILYLNQKQYVPVRGKNSLILHAQLGKLVPWVLVVEGFLTVLDAVLYSIGVKAQTGGFTVVEKSLALKRLYSIADEMDDSVYSLLDISRNERIKQHYLTLADAPAAIKDMVSRGVLHENTAFEIFNLESAAWVPAAEFITEVALGTKKRNEIIVMLRDIARRDRKELLGLIGSGPMQAILHDTGMDPSHRGEKLYRYMRNTRYPSIHAYRSRFDKKLREVSIDGKFHLLLPENFEKWEFRLVIPFSSLEEFQDNIERLQKTGKQSSFAELMNMRY
jgi:hypothetical protein